MNFSFPAVKGRQGNRDFYIASVPFSALSRLIDIDRGNPLQRSQREVDEKRAIAIMNYCQDQPDTYVLPCLTGDVVDPSMEFISTDGLIGHLTLSLDATVRLFDGQHRATAIMALVRNGFRENQDGVRSIQAVGIKLFTGMGLEDRQQAFSDINSKAKAVSKSLNLAYDHRNDRTALLTSLASTVLPGRIDFDKNIASKNGEYLVSFKHFTEGCQRFFKLKNLKEFKPQHETILQEWLPALASGCGWLGDKTEDISHTALGFFAIMQVAGFMFSRQDETALHTSTLLSVIDFRRDNPQWGGIVVDSQGRMIVSKASERALCLKILKLMGIELTPFEADAQF